MGLLIKNQARRKSMAAAKSCVPATFLHHTRMFRILQRTRRHTKTPKDRSTKRTGHHEGQARDHSCVDEESKTNPAIASSATDQESSSLRGNSSTHASYDGELNAIPLSLGIENNCFYFKGIKVEIIDWTHKVFIIDMVPPAVCDLLRSTVMHHCQAQQLDGKKTWRTLYTYTKMDLPCCEIRKVTEIAQRLVVNINQILSVLFKTSIELHPRSWKEPHFLRYQHGSEQNHVGVESHYDGSDFTWSLMLSRPDEYGHGGTYIRPLRTTLRLDQGQVLLHPGDLFHTGLDITHGVRELLICFMDGWDSMTVDGSSDTDDCEEYQKNVKQTIFHT